MEQTRELAPSIHLQDKDDDYQWLSDESGEEPQPNGFLDSEPVPPGLENILPPTHPPGWKTDPCWYYDTAPEIPCQARAATVAAASADISNSSPDQASAPKKRKRRSQKKRKLKTGYRERRVKETNQKLTEAQSSERVSLLGLNKKVKTSQPSSIFHHTPEQLLQMPGYKKYTLAEVVNGLRIRDNSGNMLVHLFALDTLSSPTLLSKFVSNWDEYESSIKTLSGSSGPTRKASTVLGCEFKSRRFLQPYMTTDYRGPNTGRHYKRENNPFYMSARRLGEASRNFFHYVESLIENHYPDIHSLYKNINVPEGCHKFAGLFAAVSISKLVTTVPYRNLGDIKGGLCVIINWGDFTGGELVFTELTCVVPFPSGSIIMFRSAAISYSNLPVVGERFSMVFMTDKRLKGWSDKQN